MLRLEQVRIRFHDQMVLRGVNMDVPASKTTVLIGRNGAGKTTTLRSIMGVLVPESGRVLLDDLDLSRVASHERARLGIGYAPEDRRLIPDFSVQDNLLVPAIALKLAAAERRRRLDEVFALLPEVAEFRQRPGGVLSGGQGKMVALGRALMAGTRYVLLDEPFQGLAPALALGYANTLVRLRESRPELGLLITESTPRLLDKIVDNSLLIERGEISAQGRQAA
ncbi:MAG: ATP-binding cassette domain-containing protein [Hyphomicrobiales bacterium]|nr:ATP-binding cassette domain-containing protein [Hyphomicrobiales bacterium]